MDYSLKALDEMKEYADSDKGYMVQRMLAALGEQLDKPCGRCTASRYIDRMSGKNAGRPELRRMLEYVRRGDSPMKGRMPDDRAIAAGALDAFLTWFIQQYQQEEDYLRRLYEKAAAEGRLDRLKTGLFCLRWAFDCFLRFAPDVEALGETEYRQTSQFLDMILLQMEASQRRLLSSIDAKTPKASIPELHWAGIKEQTIPLDKKLKKLDSIHALIRENDLFGPPILLETFFSAQEGYQGTTRNKISHELKAAGILVLHEKDRSNTVKLKEGLPRMVHIRLDILEEIVAQPMISDSKGGIHENHPPASTHR